LRDAQGHGSPVTAGSENGRTLLLLARLLQKAATNDSSQINPLDLGASAPLHQRFRRIHLFEYAMAEQDEL